jgi:hypothetical protein
LARVDRKRTTYIETNTLSDLSRLRDHAARIPGIAEVRQGLLSSASKRTIVVSQHLLSEMAGYESGKRRHLFEADITFLNSLPNLKVFKGQGEMMGLEVSAFLREQTLEPFIDANFPIDYDDPEWKRLFEDERDWVENTAKRFWAEYEGEAKGRIDETYPDREERRAKLAADWPQDSHRTVERFVRDVMISTRAQLGLPDDETNWPDPPVLPTLWCSWAYLLTRAILVEILPKPPKQKASDVIDWLHYQSAAYADEFVTTDKWLLQIAREAPGPKPEFLSLEEWVARLRVEP